MTGQENQKRVVLRIYFSFISNYQQKFIKGGTYFLIQERFSSNIWGAFHSTKFSGLKFRVLHATNGTVFSGSKFGAKTEDSFTFVYLLSGCSIDDAEVKINDVLGEGDNATYNLS